MSPRELLAKAFSKYAGSLSKTKEGSGEQGLSEKEFTLAFVYLHGFCPSEVCTFNFFISKWMDYIFHCMHVRKNHSKTR